MKNLSYCGLLIALFTTTHMSAGNGDKPVKSSVAHVFTDCPAVTEMDAVRLEAAIHAAVPRTITVNGSGGYNAGTGVVCPNPTTDLCATVVTAFINGTYGPDAKVEDAKTLIHYAGIIARPITDSDGNVINFRFSSLTPID